MIYFAKAHSTENWQDDAQYLLFELVPETAQWLLYKQKECVNFLHMHGSEYQGEVLLEWPGGRFDVFAYLYDQSDPEDLVFAMEQLDDDNSLIQETPKEILDLFDPIRVSPAYPEKLNCRKVLFHANGNIRLYTESKFDDDCVAISSKLDLVWLAEIAMRASPMHFVPMINTVYVKTIEVIDPESKLPVEVEIRKMNSGSMVGLDASWLSHIDGDPRTDFPWSPYDHNYGLMIPDNEITHASQKT